MSETSDDYDRVICQHDRYRIVRCRDDYQFIVQKRARTTEPRPWRALAYIYDKTKLCALLQRRYLAIPPELITAWKAADV